MRLDFRHRTARRDTIIFAMLRSEIQGNSIQFKSIDESCHEGLFHINDIPAGRKLFGEFDPLISVIEFLSIEVFIDEYFHPSS